MAAEPEPRTIARPAVGIGGGVLLGTYIVFAFTTALPYALSFAIAIGAAAGAIGLRASSGGRRTNTALVVALVGLALLAFFAAPDAVLGGLGGGAAVLGTLAWLADAPGRVAGGMRRATRPLALTGFAFAAAWAIAFLLPSASVSVGIVGGLLVLALVIVTVLLARGTVFERERPFSE